MTFCKDGIFFYPLISPTLENFSIFFSFSFSFPFLISFNLPPQTFHFSIRNLIRAFPHGLPTSFTSLVRIMTNEMNPLGFSALFKKTFTFPIFMSTFQLFYYSLSKLSFHFQSFPFSVSYWPKLW